MMKALFIAGLLLGATAWTARGNTATELLDAARSAEAEQDWALALSKYETLYETMPTDQATRARLWKKFAELRPKVPANTNITKAGVWRVNAYAFQELDFRWTDKEGQVHRARYRYQEEEIERLRRGMKAFAGRVWEFSAGNLRIDWNLQVIESPLMRLDGEDSFWPGPDACMPHLVNLRAGDTETIMVFVKVFGDAPAGETKAEVPQMLLGGALGVIEPLTKGATYIGFNWGTGTASNEPDGEPMVHEWLHSAQWALEDHQHYPAGLMATSDGGRMEGEEGGDPCYRRRPDETTWMRFYEHIMRDHVTRKMWREISPNRPPVNIWAKAKGSN